MPGLLDRIKSRLTPMHCNGAFESHRSPRSEPVCTEEHGENNV